MRRSNLNDEKALREWWDQRQLERPQLWRDLTDKQQVLMTAWFMLADAEPPSRREISRLLPLKCAPALCFLAITTGRNAGFRFSRSHQVPAPANKSRQVRVRKERHQLA